MTEELEIRKAERTKIKVKVGISGVQNSGKTRAALEIAYGLCGDWNKMLVINSEANKSADLYAHDFCDDKHQYSIIDLTESRDYSPEQYVKALKKAEGGAFEVVIIDSITHEWDAILESVDLDNKKAEAENRKLWGNGWVENGARHKAFLQAIMTSSCHVILTCRQDEEIKMVVDDKGRERRKVIGLKDMTRKGWSYDLTLHFIIDAANHEAISIVDRSHMFQDEAGVAQPFMIDENTGKKIKEWANIGVDVAAEKNDALYNIGKEESGMDLGILYEAMSPSLKKNAEIQQAMRKRAIDVVDLAHTGKELADGYRHAPPFLLDDIDLKKAILNAAVELIPNHKTIAELSKFWNDMCNKENPALPFVKKDDRFYANMRGQQQNIVKWNEIKTPDELAATFKLLPCVPTETEKAEIKKQAAELMRRCNSETELSAACYAIVGNKDGTVPAPILFLREDKEFVHSIGAIHQEIKNRPPAALEELPDFGNDEKKKVETGAGGKRPTKVKFARKDAKKS